MIKDPFLICMFSNYASVYNVCVYLWETSFKELQDIVRSKNALALRKKVCDFVQTSPDVARNRVDLQVQVETDAQTWNSYWTEMRIWNTWATGPVLIGTAGMLGININMVETMSSLVCLKSQVLYFQVLQST